MADGYDHDTALTIRQSRLSIPSISHRQNIQDQSWLKDTQSYYCPDIPHFKTSEP